MDSNDYMTLREKIIDLLLKTDKPLTATEIIELLGLPINDKSIVYDALQHVAKTIRRRTMFKYELVMIPPVCKNCGYVFKELDKPKKPSKCPRCKSERISEPQFMIRER